jgi:hypothetical protein
MTDVPQSPTPGFAPALLGRRSPVQLYAATLFLSAFLLFWVQPLVAKMVLPLLGGAPAVWNTAMMFFQLVLLAGYLYAHVLNRHVSVAIQPWLHGVVVVVAFACLPIGIGTEMPHAGHSPILWLMARLALSAGLPFFALSASAPLLQTWFARTAHNGAADPYFLYAASNLGSLLALIGFPLALEPCLTLESQSGLWMLLYAVLAVLLAGSALVSRGVRITVSAPAARDAAARIALGERSLWIALAFAPSSLLLGVTSFITSDVASAPLLWVVPLALYLLSFVVTFARRPLIPLPWSLLGQAAAVSLVLLLATLPEPPLWPAMTAHFAAFFLCALVCHGALAARRPQASQLTEFYFCLAIGGALGGIFNALLAPVLFSATYEYPLALVCCCLLRHWAGAARPARWGDTLLPLALLAGTCALILGWEVIGHASPGLLAGTVLLPPIAVFFLSGRSLAYALAVAAVLAPVTIERNTAGILDHERSFFGVHRVKVDADLPALDLVHGTVSHGAEFTDPARWRDEIRYYHPAGPLGQLFAALLAFRSEPQRIAVIGLGSGALACYGRADDSLTFFEIDAAVERFARDTRYFHYLEQCGRRSKIVLGDARLSLNAATSDRFDLLILDAFSSDAIPVHLLTREALQLYLDRLAEHGLLLLHISNQHLKLWPMLHATAAEMGLAQRHQLFLPSAEQKAAGATGSEWIVMSRSEADLAFLDAKPFWTRAAPSRLVRPWTDDFSNILSVIGR